MAESSEQRLLFTERSCPASHQIKMVHADVPAGRRVAESLRREDLGSVHQPFHDRAGVVTPEDVAAAITIEIAGARLMPLRAGIAERLGRSKLPRRIGLPERHGTVVIDEQDVAPAIAIEISDIGHMP